MDDRDVARLFQGPDGYRFARWGRPIAPVVFGVDDATLSVVKGALEAVVSLAGHQMAETDPELGSNAMFFFLRDWSELADVPDLDRLVPGLAALVPRLEAEGAQHYRLFRCDEAGAIRAVFVFVRIAGDMAEMAAEDLALLQAVGMILMWGEGAFAEISPLARVEGQTVLRPEIAGVIRAAYDPVMPVAAADESHAMRLAARLAV